MTDPHSRQQRATPAASVRPPAVHCVRPNEFPSSPVLALNQAAEALRALARLLGRQAAAEWLAGAELATSGAGEPGRGDGE